MPKICVLLFGHSTAKNGSNKTKYDQLFLPVSVAPPTADIDACHYTMLLITESHAKREPRQDI